MSDMKTILEILSNNKIDYQLCGGITVYASGAKLVFTPDERLDRVYGVAEHDED